jgi:hypothetical protein
LEPGSPTPLSIVARGEVEVDPAPHIGAPGRVHYMLRTTRGFNMSFGIAIAVDLGFRWFDTPVAPPFAFSTVMAVLWAARYVLAWLRAPLLLMRAADGDRVT